MNQRSGHSSFDAAMLSFKTRQRLEGGGVGENEGDGPTLGSVGGLALCAGLGLHGSDGLCSLGPKIGGAGFKAGHVFLVGLPALAAGGDLVAASLGQHFSESGLASESVLDGGHGLLQTGPIPAMSNPNPVTSDKSSAFGKKIMNGVLA